MNPEEIISRLTVVHKNSPIGLEHDNFYTPESTHRIISQLTEHINLLHDLLKGRIPDDPWRLNDDISTLGLNPELEKKVRSKAADPEDMKIKELLMIGMTGIFGKEEVLDALIVTMELRKLGIETW